MTSCERGLDRIADHHRWAGDLWMKDLTSLRAAAEKVVGAGWYMTGNDDTANFINAANPATVLELVDEVERLERRSSRLFTEGTEHAERAITTANDLERSQLQVAELITRLTASQARAGELEGAIQRAADVFTSYVEMHLDKGTPEGIAKAAANAKHRNELLAALTGGGGEGFRSARDHERSDVDQEVVAAQPNDQRCHSLEATREYLRRQAVDAFRELVSETEGFDDEQMIAVPLGHIRELAIAAPLMLETLEAVRHWLLTVPEPGTYGATTLAIRVNEATKAVVRHDNRKVGPTA